MNHQALFTRTALHRAHAFDLRYRIAADYAAIAAMHRARARMKRVAFTININTIEPEAISIAGKALCVAEYFRVQREILKVGTTTASLRFLCQRTGIFIVRMLQRLPRRLYDALPMAIRRRRC
jgi:hypothetical protein